MNTPGNWGAASGCLEFGFSDSVTWSCYLLLVSNQHVLRDRVFKFDGMLSTGVLSSEFSFQLV